MPLNLRDNPNIWAQEMALNAQDVRASAANSGDGAITVLYRHSITDAATGDVSIVVTHAVRVIQFWFVKTAGAGASGNTIQLKNAANAISDALDTNVADQVVVRAATIDDARHELAAGGELRVTRTKSGGNAAGIAYTLAVRI